MELKPKKLDLAIGTRNCERGDGDDNEKKGYSGERIKDGKGRRKKENRRYMERENDIGAQKKKEKKS